MNCEARKGYLQPCIVPSGAIQWSLALYSCITAWLAIMCVLQAYHCLVVRNVHLNATTCIMLILLRCKPCIGFLAAIRQLKPSAVLVWL